MTSQKCPNCGLITWSGATQCKSCNTPLGMGDGTFAVRPSTRIVDSDKPTTVLGIMMIIWGALMLTGGFYALSFGQVTHLLVGGSTILISGVAVTRRKLWVMPLYFLGLLVMFVWMIATGEKIVLSIGSFLYAAVIGLLVTTRRVPVLAGLMLVLSCIASVGALALPLIMRPGQVAWQNFQPAEGMFSVQMPAKPVKRDWGIEFMSGYTAKQHVYESSVWRQGSAFYIVVEFSPALDPTELSEYDKFLEAELAIIVKHTNSTPLFKQKTTVNGNHVLNYQLNPPAMRAKEQQYSVGRIVMNADRLYVVHLTAGESTELLGGMDKFLQPSFLAAQPQTVSDNQPARQP